MVGENKKILWLLQHNNCWCQLQWLLDESSKSKLEQAKVSYIRTVMKYKNDSSDLLECSTEYSTLCRGVYAFEPSSIVMKDILDIDPLSFKAENTANACEFFKNNLIDVTSKGIDIRENKKIACNSTAGKSLCESKTTDASYNRFYYTNYAVALPTRKSPVAFNRMWVITDIDIPVYDIDPNWLLDDCNACKSNRGTIVSGHLKYKFNRVNSFCVRGRINADQAASEGSSQRAGSMTSLINFPNEVCGNLVFKEMYMVRSFEGFPKHVHGSVIFDSGKYPKVDFPDGIVIDGNIEIYSEDSITLLFALVRSSIMLQPGKNIISPLYSGTIEHLREVAVQRHWPIYEI